MAHPTNIEIVWEAVPNSSQEFALDTRADHTLLFGTRGSGKTITQLMYFRRFVGLGYGSFWRGVIFDREFKNLADLEAQSRRYFPQFDDGAKFLAAGSDYKWVWPTGEELLFRHVKKDTDYENFHGHEYCLWENEEIVTDRGCVAIKNLNIGDNVLTPVGYKKVAKKFNVGLKDCVKVSTYTSDGRSHSEQRQSVDHHLLTNEEGFLIPRPDSCHSVPLYVEKFRSVEVFDKCPPCDLQETKVFSAQQECEEIFSKLFGKHIRNIQLTRTCPLLKELRVILLLKYHEMLQGLSTFFRGTRGFFLRLLERMVNQTKLCLGHRLPQEPVSQARNPSILNLNGLLTCGLSALRKVSSWLDRCFFDLRRCGELAHNDTENDQFVVRSQLDVQEPNRYATSGDSSVLLGNNRLYQLVFQHPYHKDRLLYSNLEWSEGYCTCAPCGSLLCFDIEVEDVNCYITKAGLINKNCFIGFNELTKWPTGDLYDRFMSVNRGSFVPEKHTPVKIVDGKRVYDTPDKKPLPPIPLKFFSTTNSSGPGRSWVKKRFVDPAAYGEIVSKEFEVYSAQEKRDVTVYRTQTCIFSSYKENPYLPPIYIASLKALTDNNENLRKSWLEGSWDITSGGALDDLWDTNIHVIDRFPVPANWRVDRSLDWGSSKPYAVIWWAEADGTEVVLPEGVLVHGQMTFCPEKGSLIAIAELYGTKEIGTNKGLVRSASDVADDIVGMERSLLQSGWIKQKPIAGPADNSIGKVEDKKLDTVEKLFSDKGVRWIKFNKPSGSREIGLQMFRDRLECALKGEGKAIYFMRIVKGCIETIPPLPRDEKNQDDVDSDAEDHCFAGETLIKTSRGSFKIQDLVGTTGLVFTENGKLTKYHTVRKTRQNAEVIKLLLSDGTSVICTPDHQFLTNLGWKKASCLFDTKSYIITDRINISIFRRFLWKSMSFLKRFRSLTANVFTGAGFIFNTKV